MMKPAFLLLLLMTLGASAWEAFPLFSDDLSFYQSFDGSSVADLSLGRETAIWKAGTPKYAPGLRGQALVCGQGGGVFRYARKDNMNFDRPGTVVFFYRTSGWDRIQKWPRCFFWAIESGQGYLGLQGANDPKHIPMKDRGFQLMLLYGKRLPAKVYGIDNAVDPADGRWHMLAFSWAGSQLTVKQDDRPPAVCNYSMTLQDGDFPADYFSVGSGSYWNYLLDDFIIYKRRITDAELNQLFHANMKGQP